MNFRLFDYPCKGSCGLATKIAKVCGTFNYRSRVYYGYKSLQGVVVDEEIYPRAWFQTKQLCVVL